jgi:hypothetical protein
MDGHYDSYHLFAIYLADLDGKLDSQAEGPAKWARALIGACQDIDET